jgi:hypothetical protein
VFSSSEVASPGARSTGSLRRRHNEHGSSGPAAGAWQVFPRGRRLAEDHSALHTTAADICAHRRIFAAGIAAIELRVVSREFEGWGLSGAALFDSEPGTFGRDGAVESVDDGPFEQNGAKSEGGGEIHGISQDRFLALSARLLLAHC